MEPAIIRASPADFLQPKKTAGYYPSVLQGDWYGRAIDDKPWFTQREALRMRRDPQVQFGLRILRAPLYRCQWTVEADSMRVAKLVDSTVRTFWESALRPVLNSQFMFGWVPGEITHRSSMGQVILDSISDIHPNDAKPLEIENKHGAPTFCGIRVRGLNQSNHSPMTSGQPYDVLVPHAFWHPGEAEYGSYYGRPRLADAFAPWSEKSAKGGAVESRRLWFKKCAFRGGSMRHPMGTTEYETSGGGTITINNEDLAREIVERYENGGVLTLPNTKDPTTGEYLWIFEPPGTNGEANGIREYPQDLDREILVGLGIPPEVIQAAETGSGYSGRSIPMVVFMASCDEVASNVLNTVIVQLCRPLVALNCGPKHMRRFRVKLKPLNEVFGMDENAAKGAFHEPDGRRFNGGWNRGMGGQHGTGGDPNGPGGDPNGGDGSTSPRPAVQLSQAAMVDRLDRIALELSRAAEQPRDEAGRFVSVNNADAANGDDADATDKPQKPQAAKPDAGALSRLGACLWAAKNSDDGCPREFADIMLAALQNLEDETLAATIKASGLDLAGTRITKDRGDLLDKIRVKLGIPIDDGIGEVGKEDGEATDPIELSRSADTDGGRWITIGAQEGPDGEKHGGSPVFIKGGVITKGHPRLVGRKISNLSEEPTQQTTHRQELARSKSYELAKHRKAANEHGHDPEHLDHLAAEFKRHHNEFVKDHAAMLRDARLNIESYSGKSLNNLSRSAGKGGKDYTSVQGLDVAAAEMARKFPHLFKPENGENGSIEDQLFEHLVAGNRKGMTDEQAYEEAFNHLMSQEPHKAGGEDVPTDDEIFGGTGTDTGLGHKEQPATADAGGDDDFDFGANASDGGGEQAPDTRGEAPDTRGEAPDTRVGKIDPLDITPENLKEHWERERDEIANHDPKISPNQAGAIAAARIMNSVDDRASEFIEAIDKKVASGEPITDEEDDKYIEAQTARKKLYNPLVNLSGYRPGSGAEDHPLAVRPWNDSPLEDNASKKATEAAKHKAAADEVAKQTEEKNANKAAQKHGLTPVKGAVSWDGVLSEKENGEKTLYKAADGSLYRSASEFAKKQSDEKAKVKAEEAAKTEAEAKAKKQAETDEAIKKGGEQTQANQKAISGYFTEAVKAALKKAGLGDIAKKTKAITGGASLPKNAPPEAEEIRNNLMDSYKKWFADHKVNVWKDTPEEIAQKLRKLDG